MMLYKASDPQSAIVIVFDCSSSDACGPFFHVVRHFVRRRELLSVTTNPNVLQSLVDQAGGSSSLPGRIFSSFTRTSRASNDAALAGVEATLRPALQGRASSRVLGVIRPPLLSGAAPPPQQQQHQGASGLLPPDPASPLSAPASASFLHNTAPSSQPRLSTSASVVASTHRQPPQALTTSGTSGSTTATAAREPGLSATTAASAAPATARPRPPSSRRSLDALPIRQRLERVYRHYCPDKLPTLEAALAKYAGQEEALLGTVVAKYGPEPPLSPSEGDGDPRAARQTRPTGPVGQEFTPSDVHRPTQHRSIHATPASAFTSPSRRGTLRRDLPFDDAFEDDFMPSGVDHDTSSPWGGQSASQLLFGQVDRGRRQPDAAELAALKQQQDLLDERCEGLLAECIALEAKAAAVAARNSQQQAAADDTTRIRRACAQEVALASLVMAACHESNQRRRLGQQADAEDMLARHAKAARGRLVDLLDPHSRGATVCAAIDGNDHRPLNMGAGHDLL
jgi:hypothetical protein